MLFHDRSVVRPEAETSNATVRPGFAVVLTKVAAVSLMTASLMACANPKTEAELTTGSVDLDGYRTRHPIVLAQSAETLDIPVGQQGSELSGRMGHTVEVFAHDARLHGAKGITILLPAGAGNDAAARKIASQVTSALMLGGFPRNAIARTTYAVPEGTPEAPLRIAYARIKAMVQHSCGQWPDSLSNGNVDNRDDWEIGCSGQSNLAAMVVNPEDLVTPTGEDPIDGTRRTMVITKYRAGIQTKSETGAKATTIADGVQGGN